MSHSDGAQGLEVPKAEVRARCDLFERRSEPTRATPYGLFVVDAKDEINKNLRERMEVVADKKQMAGERRKIQKAMFDNLPQEERDEYEADAKEISKENKAHFVERVSEDIIHE